MTENDHGAKLIGQPIPDMAGTEPRLNRECPGCGNTGLDGSHSWCQVCGGDSAIALQTIRHAFIAGAESKHPQGYRVGGYAYRTPDDAAVAYVQHANVSGATRTDSAVAEGVTLAVGEKPPYSAQECEHWHLGGCSKCQPQPHTCHGNEHMPPGPCLACASEQQECAEEVIYRAVNFLRGPVWDRETEKLALALERVALDIENGTRPIVGSVSVSSKAKPSASTRRSAAPK